MLRSKWVAVAAFALAACGAVMAVAESADNGQRGRRDGYAFRQRTPVQVGPRPYYLVDDMAEGKLKGELLSCAGKPLHSTRFSIGHRGAALQFPEHTRESYVAAARMGAGIVECDVTFTKDRELVCRHSQCDLHSTTNILAIPELASKCRQPFVPADPEAGTAAQAECCTSDITLDEFLSLCGKMDASEPDATTVEEYLGGTPGFRTDLYSTCGTVMSHAQSIALLDQLGVDFTPELKEASVEMPFEGQYTQQDYAQQMIGEYRAAGISPGRVFAQSFDLQDILYWVQEEPEFGRQAVYLDSRVDSEEGYAEAVAGMAELRRRGVRIVAPPMFALVTLDATGAIVPSSYARAAQRAGLDMITWTLERSGLLAQGGGYYYASVAEAIGSDGDMLQVLDVLARQVEVKGVFADWPGTVTYYANCMGLGVAEHEHVPR